RRSLAYCTCTATATATGVRQHVTPWYQVTIPVAATLTELPSLILRDTGSDGALRKHAHTSEGEKPAQGAPGARASPAPRNSGTAPVGPQTAPDRLVRRCPGRHGGDGGFRPPGDAQPPGADDAENCRGQRPGRDSLGVTTPSRSFPGRPGWALTRPAPAAPEAR